MTPNRWYRRAQPPATSCKASGLEERSQISPVYASKLKEVQSVFNELKQFMGEEQIGRWLLEPMEEFDDQSPADIIKKGETGRLWASLLYLRSGMPD